MIGEVASRTPILILFSDDLITGPVWMRPATGKPDIFVIDPESWAQPKQAWGRRGDIEPLKFNVRDYGDVSFTPLPSRQPDTYIDFAPGDFALRKVLEMVRASQNSSTALTQAKIRELSTMLAALPSSPELKPRIAALASRLNTLDATTTDFAELVEHCIRLPAVEIRIQQEARKAKESALAEVAREQAQALETLGEKKKEIENLSSQIAALGENKAQLLTEIQQTDAAAKSSKTAFNEAIAQAASDAEKDVVGFLAKLAILRPFLSEKTAKPEPVRFDSLKVEPVNFEAKIIQGADNGVKRLTEILKG